MLLDKLFQQNENINLATKWVSVWLLFLCAALPSSMFVMSVSGILLSAGYVFGGEYAEKWKVFKANRLLHVFLGFYLLHLIGLAYTSDWDYGMEDVRKKLPLLYLPVVLSFYGRRWSSEFWKLLFAVFVSACLAVTLIGFGKLLSLEGNYNYRSLSPFISHIRLALLLIMAIGFCAIQFFQTEKRWQQMMLVLLIGWFLYFLNVMQSATAFAILFPLVFIGVYQLGKVKKMSWVKWSSVIAVAVPAVFLGFWAGNYFYTVDDNPEDLVKEFTVNGSPYISKLSDKTTENGHYIYLNVCFEEIEQQWPKKIKSLGFDGGASDYNHARVIRYLTSKNLSKDSVGVWSLEQRDVQNILDGFTNYKFAERKLKFLNRLDEICFELQGYFGGYNPSNHSIPQRFEYAKAGLNIASQHLLLGVGTGDVKQAYKQHYEDTKSQLKPEVRRRAHNQWLTLFVAFGLFGGFLACVTLVFPIIKHGFTAEVILFSTISFLSFLTEDTLETQAGATFFGLFYSLFVFAKAHLKK